MQHGKRQGQLLMADVRTTENEFRGQVITWLNQQLERGGTQFERATQDPLIRVGKGEKRLPDVPIWPLDEIIGRSR